MIATKRALVYIVMICQKVALNIQLVENHVCWNLFRSFKSYQKPGYLWVFRWCVHTNLIGAKRTLVLVIMVCPKVVPRHSVIGFNEIGKSAHFIPPVTQLPIGKD